MAFRLVAQRLDVPTAIRRLTEAANELGAGRSNAYGEFTLAVSTTTTSVTDTKVGIDSVITLMPTTANAAAAMATTYVSNRKIGSFTLTHASNGQTDRTFAYAITG